MMIARLIGGVVIDGVCANDGAATTRASSNERIVNSRERRRESIRLRLPGINASLRGEYFEQSRCAHPTTDAHRHHTETTAALPELVHELCRQLRSRCAQRMPERDRAAVDVDLLLRQPELANDGDDLCRERLVELDEIDVLELEPRALECLGNRF